MTKKGNHFVIVMMAHIFSALTESLVNGDVKAREIGV